MGNSTETRKCSDENCEAGKILLGSYEKMASAYQFKEIENFSTLSLPLNSKFFFSFLKNPLMESGEDGKIGLLVRRPVVAERRIGQGGATVLYQTMVVKTVWVILLKP